MRFRDRADAGRQLSARLGHYAERSDVVVLGLPRGGLPVAFEVATRLAAPLDACVVRKLGVPGQPEVAMGALASGGVRVLNPDLIGALDVPPDLVEQVTAREQAELARRETAYRGARPPEPVRDRVAILVDDGLATGSTMEAAVVALRRQAPARVVVAVPVGAPEACARLARLADEVVCLSMPDSFEAVGRWYDDFSQTSDEEVTRLLAIARPAPSADLETP